MCTIGWIHDKDGYQLLCITKHTSQPKQELDAGAR